jgi:hypothetical protein
MQKRKKISLLIIASLTGGVMGYIYYTIKGCESGCMIWSSPILSSLVGGLLCFLITDLLIDQFSKKL